MAWLRVDDQAMTHHRVMHLREIGLEDPSVTVEGVVGWLMLCAAWSGQQMTDCWIPYSCGAMNSDIWRLLAAAALEVGILTDDERDGRKGWSIRIDDGLFHLMSKEEIEANAEKRKGARRDGNKILVLLRDGDRCRYDRCGGQTVNPHDTRGKSGRGRELEHVDPEDQATDLVVACKSCNGHKGRRTPERAGMQLLPAPDINQRHYHQTTLNWLAERDVDPHNPTTWPAHPETGLAVTPANLAEQRLGTTAAASQERDQPTPEQPQAPGPTHTPDPPTRSAPDPPVPGRDGQGRAGLGSGKSTGQGKPQGSPLPRPDPPPTPRRPRPRGKRGGRGRKPKPPTQDGDS